MEEYQHRTKEISGTNYTVSLWSNANEEARMHCSPYDSWEAADAAGKRMLANFPNGKYEIGTHPWKRKVCIECGEETYW